MKKHVLTALSLTALLSLCTACSKKEPPKPVHTEPWLAHPPASAAASADAALPLTRYTLGAQSQVHFELLSKHGTLRGSFSHVTGEFELDASDLSRSRGQIQVDLSSLAISADGSSDDAAMVTAAKNALGVADGGSAPNASFELSSLEDVSPAQLEPAPDTDGGVVSVRRAHGTAVGNLLLHGFRVQRHAQLAAEFSFAAGTQLPASVVIRSRAPFVISLETHEIRVPADELRKKAAKGSSPHAREARVSVQLYGTKVN